MYRYLYKSPYKLLLTKIHSRKTQYPPPASGQASPNVFRALGIEAWNLSISINVHFYPLLCFLYAMTLLLPPAATSQKIHIRLMTGISVKSFIFTPVSGDYIVYSDSVELHILKKNEVIFLQTVNGDSIEIKTVDKYIGILKTATIKSLHSNGYGNLKTVNPKGVNSYYDDDIIVNSFDSVLYIVNPVEADKYIAGVVESEGGPKSHYEYYKTQAVICRTYTIENFNRHIFEGYNLCDDVHCQSYKGRSMSNPEIGKAVSVTSGLIIVDSLNSIITAGFHSNCGGQTTNSGDVWLKSKPYLVSVSDPWCTNQRNAVWEKQIDVSVWKKYLELNGIRLDEDFTGYGMTQVKRQAYYYISSDSIPLKKIRSDWNLRSTFFNILYDNGNIVFKGRGYGHGVGLCQEGAMKMSEKGYSYNDIIEFYYRNTKIINYNDTLDKSTE